VSIKNSSGVDLKTFCILGLVVIGDIIGVNACIIKILQIRFEYVFEFLCTTVLIPTLKFLSARIFDI